MDLPSQHLLRDGSVYLTLSGLNFEGI